MSADLDYNYIGHEEREKMLADRPRVEQAVFELARRRRYRVTCSLGRGLAAMPAEIEGIMPGQDPIKNIQRLSS